jgi:signal transduction histidine kinase
VAQHLEIERARKAENERLRKQVADDFHDEFGQQLTNIALFAEIIKRRLNGASPQIEANLQKISEAAKTLSEGMRDFIWTLDRSKDSLDKVVARLRDFGETLFARTPIAFQSGEIGTAWENIVLSMDWKRHLTQIFKEGMKNSLKHAACQTVKFEVKLNGRDLEIVLMDDGKGFENTATVQGAGLRYMKKRAERIRGELHVVSQPGRGAEIHFRGQLT